MASHALAVVGTNETDIFAGDRMKLIRDKFANGAPQHEFDLFVEVCRTLNLDPLQRQVYLIPRNAKQRDGSWGTSWTIQTSIDGYRAIADRTGAYAGSDDAVFTPDYANQPETATVTVWKIVQGIRCPFTATARWSEYVQDKSPMWGKMPHTMLAKCAESLALRKAFPAQLSGVYTDSEMDQAGMPEPPTTGEIVDVEPMPKERVTDPDARTPGGASMRSLNYSLVLRDEAGVSDDDIHRWCGDQFGKVSRNDLNQAQMSRLIEWLQEVKQTLGPEPAKNGSAHDGGDEEPLSWTAFWPKARALGYANKQAIADKLGVDITPMTPDQALAAITPPVDAQQGRLSDEEIAAMAAAAGQAGQDKYTG